MLLEWVDYYCLVTQTFFCFILPDDVDVADNQTLDNRLIFCSRQLHFLKIFGFYFFIYHIYCSSELKSKLDFIVMSDY